MKNINHIPIISDKQFECPFEKPYGYIYKITNQINGHYYIGKHKFNKPYLDKKYKGSGSLLKKSYEKYGIENFETTILEWTDKDNDELNKLEKLYISVFHANETPNYNLTEGGDGITLRGEDNPMYGKRGELAPWWGRHHTEEYKKHMSEINTGKVISQYTRDLISKANSGHKMSENLKRINSETCKKRVGPKNPMWKGGHKIINKAHSEFMKGKHMSVKTEFTSASTTGANNSQAKAIVQLSLDGGLIATFEYMNKISKTTTFSVESVRKCCKGKIESYKGFKWMYLEDYKKLVEE